MTKTIVGNVHIEAKPTVVELRLVTNNGVALFTYREIPNLIAALKALKQPEDDDDWKDLI